MAANWITYNNQSYTQREAEYVCALKIHGHRSDEIIGTILGKKRSGIGGPPVPCAGLVSFLQGSSHPVYRRVLNDPGYWGSEANRLYREWMGAVGQTVRQYGARIPFLDPQSQHANFFLIALASEANSPISCDWDGGLHSQHFTSTNNMELWSFYGIGRSAGNAIRTFLNVRVFFFLHSRARVSL